MTQSDSTVDSIRPLSDRAAPHPIIVCESRYGGAYSGGEWIVTAGVRDPRQSTDAFGSDGACNTFWMERRDSPAFTVVVDGRERECYAAAGDDPSSLVQELLEYYEQGS